MDGCNGILLKLLLYDDLYICSNDFEWMEERKEKKNYEWLHVFYDCMSCMCSSIRSMITYQKENL